MQIYTGWQYLLIDGANPVKLRLARRACVGAAVVQPGHAVVEPNLVASAVHVEAVLKLKVWRLGRRRGR